MFPLEVIACLLFSFRLPPITVFGFIDVNDALPIAALLKLPMDTLLIALLFIGGGILMPGVFLNFRPGFCKKKKSRPSCLHLSMLQPSVNWWLGSKCRK